MSSWIRENSEGFQLQDVQHQQRWGGDLELASSPFFLQEGLIEWGSDLELASPGGFDSCIMDSSWTSSKEHCTPPCQGAGLDSVPSPTSSVVSVRNLSHHGSQNLLTGRIQQQQQPLIENHVDVSSSSSVGSLFNRASISDHEQQHGRRSKQRSNGGDDSVGSPFPGFSNKKGSECASGEYENQNELSGEINDRKRSSQQRGPSERMMDITLEELSTYFTMPITQASKELKVGLTVLKKRCREFGIPRWPHRKLKSLESLIHKSQELAKDSEGKAPNPVMNAVQELEKQKKRMEHSPELELDDRTKRFRQAIFKASYKQRRRAISKDSQTTATSDSNNNEDIHDTV